RARCLARHGELHSLVQPRGVHADLVGFFVLPVEPIRKIDGRGLSAWQRWPLHRPLRVERRDEHDCDNERQGGTCTRHGVLLWLCGYGATSGTMKAYWN